MLGGDGAPLPKVEKIHSQVASDGTGGSTNGSSSVGGGGGAGKGGVIEITSTDGAAAVLTSAENQGKWRCWMFCYSRQSLLQ